MVQGSGNMSVRTVQAVSKLWNVGKRQAWNAAPRVFHEVMAIYREICPAVYIGVIDYGAGNASDSRHHVLESHQRNNCWALELYKPQKAWARETPASKH